jgi:ComF family protein
MRSWLVFEGPIRRALHTLKYRRNVALGDALAQYLVEYVSALGWSVDLVVPVPLGRQRMNERGYNQVGLVASPLAALQGWRYSPQVLARVRETRSQVGLSAAERRENVSGAFCANAALASEKTILLMDDVATTGATVASCADALLKAGARAVYVLTLAKTLPHHGLQIV